MSFTGCCCSTSDWCKCVKSLSRRCSVLNVLTFTHPTNVIYFKVNASNIFGEASSEETYAYLHDISKPIPLLCNFGLETGVNSRSLIES